MASVATYFPDDEEMLVRAAAKLAGQKPAPYVADAVRQRMRREGVVTADGGVADVRAEALAAAEVVGPEAVLSALQALRSDRDRAA